MEDQGGDSSSSECGDTESTPFNPTSSKSTRTPTPDNTTSSSPVLNDGSVGFIKDEGHVILGGHGHEDHGSVVSDEEGENDEESLLSEGGKVSLVIADTQKHTSSIAGASMNFINSIIGSGIIGIPAALMQSGFVTGLVLLIVMAIITDYTIILLIRDGMLSNKFTYQDMVTAAFGRPGYWILTFTQFFFPFFAMTGYIVIVGDSFGRILTRIFEVGGADLPTVFADPQDILVKVVAVGLVMTPVSMLRNISRLEKLSGFAILCIAFIVCVAVYEVFNLYCPVRCFDSGCCDTPLTSWIVNKDLTQTVGIMAGAFVCHHNTYLIYDSLKKKSYSRFSIVSHTSVFVSFLFCCVLGLAGFLTFLNTTQGDLLNNYCGDDPVANAARFFYSCVVILTYPIECFVAREVVEIALSNVPERAVSWIPNTRLRIAVDKFFHAPRKQSLTRHIVITLFLIVSTLGIAVTTNDLGVVLAFNGCLTAIPLAFIIPTACYLKLSQSSGNWCSRQKIVALVVMVMGILVMIMGTIQAIIEVVRSYSNQGAFKPPYCTGQTNTTTTCCRLYNTTEGFTVTFDLCSCPQYCPNVTIQTQLSDDFCF